VRARARIHGFALASALAVGRAGADAVVGREAFEVARPRNHVQQHRHSCTRGPTQESKKAEEIAKNDEAKKKKESGKNSAFNSLSLLLRLAGS
jgi:hypothetical protein